MKKYNYYVLGIMAGLIMALGACKKNDDDNKQPVDPTNPEEGRFVIAVNPIASTAVADYLLTTPVIDSGTLSTKGNGIEQDGTYRYYVTHNKKFFSFLYGQGNPGAVTTYNLSGNGSLTKLSNFQTETVQTFAPAGDDILLIKIPRSETGGNNAHWYRVNTDSLKIVKEGQIDIVSLAGNGERAHFTWATKAGNKIFAPYMSIKGCCSDVFGTSYPDSSWIAVFSYPEMQLEKVIKDNRTSAIGRYMSNGLAQVENGDLYAFSAANATSAGAITSKKPSAVLRINNGTTEFDQSYFFDLEAVSGGYAYTHQLYLGNNIFLLNVVKTKSSWGTGTELAIVNVADKTFKLVSGLPAPATITDITGSAFYSYTPGDGKTAYVGVTVESGTSAVYKIDAATATAKQGLVVEGGVITAINRMSF